MLEWASWGQGRKGETGSGDCSSWCKLCTRIAGIHRPLGRQFVFYYKSWQFSWRWIIVQMLRLPWVAVVQGVLSHLCAASSVLKRRINPNESLLYFVAWLFFLRRGIIAPGWESSWAVFLMSHSEDACVVLPRLPFFFFFMVGFAREGFVN